MARVKVNYQTDRRAVQIVVGGFTRKAAVAGAENFKKRVQANITASNRIDTGKMLANWDIVQMPAKGQAAYRFKVVSRQPYTIFQEKGTRGSVAKPGKWLRFKPKGSNVFIFRKRTGPVPPAYFVRNAVRSMTVRDFFRR